MTESKSKIALAVGIDLHLQCSEGRKGAEVTRSNRLASLLENSIFCEKKKEEIELILRDLREATSRLCSAISSELQKQIEGKVK